MLALPATADQVLGQVVVPALTKLLPAKYDGAQARVMLLAFGGQETGYRTRVQLGGGPGHGFWQNEPEGVADVIANDAVVRDALGLCARCAVSPVGKDAYWALTTDDAFACAIARLMLFCDPHRLPELGDQDGAWECYLRNWRPGKPRPQDWSANYAAALAAVQADASGSAA